MEENTNEKRGPTVTLQPQNYLHCLAVLLPVLMLKLLSSLQEEVFLMPHFPEWQSISSTPICYVYWGTQSSGSAKHWKTQTQTNNPPFRELNTHAEHTAFTCARRREAGSREMKGKWQLLHTIIFQLFVAIRKKVSKCIWNSMWISRNARKNPRLISPKPYILCTYWVLVDPS